MSQYLKLIFKYHLWKTILFFGVCLLMFMIMIYPYRLFRTQENSALLDSLNLEELSLGKDELKKHKLLVFGITRNNAGHISPVISQIEMLGKEFEDYHVVIFENDSSDQTKPLLWLWSKLNERVTILNEEFHNKKRPSYKFLADIRNKYIDYAKDKFLDHDIVLIIDMDMKYGWDHRGVYDSFAKINSWDAVCASGISYGKMYDAFAFRSDLFPIGPDDPNYWNTIVWKAQIPYEVGGALVPVWSCFNGMAFYKRAFIKNCRYDSVKFLSGNEECEHIAFHDCIRKKNKGRFFLNPSMLIYYDKN